MPELEIRPPAESEGNDLFKLVGDFATSFVPRRGDFFASLQKLLTDPSVTLLCAFTGSGMAGYVLAFRHETFFANGCVTWVEELYVRPGLRRQGVASALMEAAESRARQDGSRLLALATRRADDFYEAFGYEASATYFRRLL